MLLMLKCDNQLSEHTYTIFQMSTEPFLRATAVPAGTAEARISYANSVCLSVRPSVRHDPVPIQGQVR